MRRLAFDPVPEEAVASTDASLATQHAPPQARSRLASARGILLGVLFGAALWVAGGAIAFLIWVF